MSQVSAKQGSSSKSKKHESDSVKKLVWSQLLINLGDALINPKVTLPWILQGVGVPVYLLGWLVPIRESGSLLPQLLMASYIRRVALRKWLWVIGSVLQAACVVLIGVVALLLEGAAAGWCVIALMVVFSLARGLNSITSKDVLGKTISKGRRGRVSGWASSAAGLITLGVALTMVFSGFFELEANTVFYASSLIIGALVWCFAAMVYALIDEPRSDVDHAPVGFWQLFSGLSLLKTNASFRTFVIARSLLLCTALTAPYYVLIAQQHLGNGLWVLGAFMAASGLASLVSSPFWGRFSDYSSRQVMMFSTLLGVFAGVLLFVVMWLFPGFAEMVWFMPALYFILCVAHQGVRIGRKTYLVDLVEGNDRTEYVAVSNTVIGIMLLVMSVFGLLTNVISLPALVLVFSLLALIGVLVVVRLPEA
ncbi:MFS transporter [Marinomonas aquiplantarum]|uniref:MFS transporter n=1 Tax=Marinomonas aquiplantarum TaxID=491951 RepID=A0A366D4C3_9GAMM|nr:MFS transporter [Marinomonas aquiplantarum]RBO84901.1 MFS transporter [Marinomonas aquiplantarum]